MKKDIFVKLEQLSKASLIESMLNFFDIKDLEEYIIFLEVEGFIFE